MIKNRYFILFIITILVVIKYNFNAVIKEPILDITLGIKSYYVELLDDLKNFKDKYISQKESIQRLKEEVKALRKTALLSSAFAAKLNSLLKDKSEIYTPELNITRAVSYVDLANYNRVWTDFEGLKKDKIFGLLYQGYSAGIVVNKDGRAMGLLQGDDKCIFSVYIGEKKLPGVIFGDKNDMIIRYIPSWMKVKIGDEVYTSGLDNIFFEGIKVGKITKVLNEESYTSAVVQPYAKVAVPGFFHIVTKP
ncbi:MAG: rod shape-determining protein MreC [Epsilonproteobacteria bacterium]|nr:rod shape-determining protein MreC [Campylobacterota bacterium]